MPSSSRLGAKEREPAHGQGSQAARRLEIHGKILGCSLTHSIIPKSSEKLQSKRQPGFSWALESHAEQAKREQLGQADDEWVRDDPRGWSSCPRNRLTGRVANHPCLPRKEGLPRSWDFQCKHWESSRQTRMSWLPYQMGSSEKTSAHETCKHSSKISLTCQVGEQLKAGLLSISQKGDQASWLLKGRVTLKAAHLKDIQDILLI